MTGMEVPELVLSGRLDAGALADDVVIVTGAGGGIGLAAAGAVLALGARVAIAEIDAALGEEAAQRLGARYPGRVEFVRTDVADGPSVQRLVAEVRRRFGRVDAVVNNATYAPVGQTVAESAVEAWDRSYAVNLRGPVLLARACLPEMTARGRGTFACVSSTGGPYLAPYETLKAAQLALATSLDAELEGTGVVAFTIGPGLVPTETASAAVRELAPRLGMSVERFWEMNRGAVLSVEAAGAGFAAALAQAPRYAGQEISSTQALVDCGITPDQPPAAFPRVSSGVDLTAAAAACEAVRSTLATQAAQWRERSFFERQWMLRDFKQHAGMPVERCLEQLAGLRTRLAAKDAGPEAADGAWLERLAGFYEHLGELASGYVKDSAQRDQQLRLVAAWRGEVEDLRRALGSREQLRQGVGR